MLERLCSKVLKMESLTPLSSLLEKRFMKVGTSTTLETMNSSTDTIDSTVPLDLLVLLEKLHSEVLKSLTMMSNNTTNALSS